MEWIDLILLNLQQQNGDFYIVNKNNVTEVFMFGRFL